MKKLTFIIIILLSVASTAMAQTRKISGRVTDALSGEPIPGAIVTVAGTTTGTVSDIDGTYSLTVTPKDKETVIEIKLIGYQPKAITLSSGQSTYDVELSQAVESLNEVVVSAGGIFRARREQGYTTTKVTAEELTAGKAPSLAAGLTAKVPGLQVNAVSSGVNPNYRLVLRGNRSITGNNQALIVVDNAIVSSAFLNNINPQDIDDIQVLNGAAGATLYGSEASNGVLLITTKRGQKGKPIIKLSNTLTFESISFYPKLQTRFGQGSTADAQKFDPVENQQYGPAFDGSLRELGYPLENGEQQYTTYSAKSDRNDFWETAIQDQTDLSFSFGGDKSTSYIAAQYLTATGTTPNDKYNRISVRLNNTQQLLPTLNLVYNAAYVENNYDITSATSTIYSQLLNVSANVPVLSYKDWQNDKWSNPEGWYNPWYRNPYWTVDNYRQNTKNTYLTGKVELKWDIFPGIYTLYRASLSNRYQQSKSSVQKLTYSDYAVKEQGKTNLAGSITDSHYNRYRLNQDFQLGIKKDISDFSLNLILGLSHTNNSGKELNVTATGLVIPGLYNISNRSGDSTPSEALNNYRNYGVWGDFVAGYKNYLFLHVTGRNDWTSLLSKENRSYFYPSTDLSFIPTDAISSLKNQYIVDFWKIRAAVSKTGNVNIDPYSLLATYNSITGYSNGTYFRQSSSLVSKDLKPEITKGWEIGTEFKLLKQLIDASFNYYYTSTTGQAISASIAPSSGYTGYLLNTGEVTNKGIETSLRVTPVQTKDWEVSIGANYTHNKNFLKSLHPDTKRIGVNGSSVIYAEEGYAVNQIIVADYARDDQGRVIVDKNTGYPSLATETARLGNTSPKHRLGLDLRVKWKDFTISSLFEYRGGYYVASIAQGGEVDFSGSSARSAYYNRERFVYPNSSYWDEASQQYVANNNITISDGGAGFWSMGINRDAYSNYVYSGDYWKWRELAISYDIPKTVINKIKGVQAATISLQGRNLFLWTPKSNEYTDPDYSANGDNNAIGVSNLSQTPPTRYIGGTVSLTF